MPRMKTLNVLVTGATSGIGRHAAIHLATRGYRVFATGRRADVLAEVAKEAEAQGARLETLPLDVTQQADIDAVRAAVLKATNGYGLDVLINNAGYGTSGPTELCSDEDFRRQYDVNVFGLMAMTRAFLPMMRERGSGRVLNVSSVGGRLTLPLMGVYNSTKYAVESLTNALRMELLPFGVDFVLIEPGPIRTSFNERSLAEAQPYRRSDSPYAPVTDRAEELFALAGKTAAGPEAVTRAIVRAIRSRRPRPRYVMPFSSRFFLALVAIFPTRTSDWLMRTVYGLTRKRLGLGAPVPRELGAAPR